MFFLRAVSLDTSTGGELYNHVCSSRAVCVERQRKLSTSLLWFIHYPFDYEGSERFSAGWLHDSSRRGAVARVALRVANRNGVQKGIGFHATTGVDRVAPRFVTVEREIHFTFAWRKRSVAPFEYGALDGDRTMETSRSAAKDLFRGASIEICSNSLFNK